MENKQVYTSDSLIVHGDNIYGVALYDETLPEYDISTAYLSGDYFYIYRGNLDRISVNNLPGIYYDTDKKKFVLVEVESDADKETFDIKSHIRTIDPMQIIEMINNKEAIIVSAPENSKLFLPAVTKDDDVLKRLIKLALRDKGIDIDNYRSRFVDKNALFNFKQVIKGDTRLSMLLFDRGTEALNLKYTIIIEEADPEHPIGRPLSHKLVASSDDTYDI